MEGWSEDELLQLASRMATVPAEPGVFLDRWPFIISGEPASEETSTHVYPAERHSRTAHSGGSAFRTREPRNEMTGDGSGRV